MLPCCILGREPCQHAGHGQSRRVHALRSKPGRRRQRRQRSFGRVVQPCIKRTIRSTLAAEAAALSEAQDRAEHARVVLAEMLGTQIVNWADALKIPCYYVIDAKFLVRLVEQAG